MQLDNLLTDNSRQPTIRFYFCVIMPIAFAWRFYSSQMDAVHTIRQTNLNKYHSLMMFIQLRRSPSHALSSRWSCLYGRLRHV